MERTIVPRDAQKVQHKNYGIIMFPETDELSKIISDIIKIVFKRRLVDRVLRLWIEMARGQGFPRRGQIEPSKLGLDWRNCLVIGVQFPVQLSYVVAVGENELEFARPLRARRLG